MVSTTSRITESRPVAVERSEAAARRVSSSALHEAVAAENRAALAPQALFDDVGDRPGTVYDRSV